MFSPNHKDKTFQALHHEVIEIGGDALNATIWIRRIHEEQENHSGALRNQQAETENIMDRLHSLEEEVTTMRQQILVVEARGALAEQRAEEATREMSEMARNLVRHFGIW